MLVRFNIVFLYGYRPNQSIMALCLASNSIVIESVYFLNNSIAHSWIFLLSLCINGMSANFRWFSDNSEKLSYWYISCENTTAIESCENARELFLCRLRENWSSTIISANRPSSVLRHANNSHAAASCQVVKNFSRILLSNLSLFANQYGFVSSEN